jgi:hypothetical protein
MIRPYVSKSAIECYDQCQLKYYIGYHLNYKDPGRKKTILGTMCHAVMECIALIKKEIQDGKTDGILECELGSIIWDEVSFMIPTVLSDDDVLVINKSRINKKTYCGDCNLRKGSVRIGRDFVNSLIETAWQKWTKETVEDVKFWNQEWEKCDKRDLVNYVWLVCENFEIRDKSIEVVDVEKEFDIPIEHPDCKLENGDYIRVKGFIDLVYKINGIYSYIDYKSGIRVDFATGETKGLQELSEDLQLCLYKYAMQKLYNVETVVGSILFLRDGGVFTPYFRDDSTEQVFKIIHKHINELRNCIPQPVSENRDDWKCKYLCGNFRRNSFSDSKSNCEVIRDSVRENGIDYTTLMYHKDNYVR